MSKAINNPLYLSVANFACIRCSPASSIASCDIHQDHLRFPQENVFFAWIWFNGVAILIWNADHWHEMRIQFYSEDRREETLIEKKKKDRPVRCRGSCVWPWWRHEGWMTLAQSGRANSLPAARANSKTLLIPLSYVYFQNLYSTLLMLNVRNCFEGSEWKNAVM